MEKSGLKYVHVLITLVLMFGFGFIAPFGQMTELGMKMLGVLFGAIYGITFFNPVWSCLLAMAAFGILGVAPAATIISSGIGNDSIMCMVFFFAFVAVLEQNKVTQFMANWLISRKFLSGKPWLFSYILIVGTMFVGAFGSSFPAMMVFWAILIATCNLYDMKPFSPYPTVMFMGITLGGLASSSTWLFRGNPLFVNATLKGATQGALSLNFGRYALFSFLMWMCALAGYVLLCKYVLRIDLGKLKDIDDSIVDKKSLILDKRQKLTLFFMFSIVALFCAIGFTPKTTAIGALLSNWGTTIPIIIILTIMSVIYVDGEPLVNFSEAARKGVVWDTVILSGSLLCLATLLMTLDTGLAATLVSFLSPIFAGHSVTFMCVVIFIISVVLTNFMANTTVGLMFTPVILTFAGQMGFNPLPVIAMMLIAIHVAFITPAASPFASMLFGYTNWVKPTDIYKYGIMGLIMMVVVFLIVGIPLSNVLI